MAYKKHWLLDNERFLQTEPSSPEDLPLNLSSTASTLVTSTTADNSPNGISNEENPSAPKTTPSAANWHQHQHQLKSEPATAADPMACLMRFTSQWSSSHLPYTSESTSTSVSSSNNIYEDVLPGYISSSSKRHSKRPPPIAQLIHLYQPISSPSRRKSVLSGGHRQPCLERFHSGFQHYPYPQLSRGSGCPRCAYCSVNGGGSAVVSRYF